jgi:transcription termination factor Rho
MSEESENQPAAESRPAAKRRPAARKRAPRRKNESTPDREAVQHLENGDSSSMNSEAAGETPRNSSERTTEQLANEGGAAAVASSEASREMELGSEKQSASLSSNEAREAVETPPQNERRFRNRRERFRDRRNRDRDRNRDNDRAPGDDRADADRQPESAENGERRDYQQQPQQPVELEFGEGIIEISGKGFGFLRDPKRNFVQTPQDIFVTPEIVRRFALRDGMWIQGETRRGNRGPQLMRLNKINDDEPTKYQDLRPFEELTTINPNKRIKLETVPDRYTTRIMDLMTPLGMGQRGLIVAPPRTGKTTLLHHIADAVTKNHPEMKLIILLVDERPEEVTDFRRSCPGAEIMASSNDSDIKSHTRIAQLAIERAKRMVEAGKHVFILLDSITRTARAFNNATGGGGRTMSGGIDARAMEIPRKIFAAARNTEEAGSLTIVATALIETGSRMDELIFQEFKGTGNMELVLDRKISDQRIYPAVDIFLSGTRREELLLQAWELEKINLIRRGLAGHKPDEAIQRLLMFVKKFPTNTQMLKEIPG